MFTGHSCEDAGRGFSSGADNTSLKSLRNQTMMSIERVWSFIALFGLLKAGFSDWRLYKVSIGASTHLSLEHSFRCCQMKYNESGTKPTGRRHNVAVSVGCHCRNFDGVFFGAWNRFMATMADKCLDVNVIFALLYVIVNQTRLSRVITARPTHVRTNNLEIFIGWQLTVTKQPIKRSIDKTADTVLISDTSHGLIRHKHWWHRWNSEKGRGWEGIPLMEKNWSQVTISWSKVCLINSHKVYGMQSRNFYSRVWKEPNSSLDAPVSQRQ